MNTSTTTEQPRPEALKQSWDELKKVKPGIRIRDAAVELGVSEAELLATTVGEKTIRLAGDWTEFMRRLPELGRVMSLTRNDSCVLEHKGPFQKIDIMGEMPHAMATVIGPIELRVFFKGWRYGFAVEQTAGDRVLKSLQVFDASGDAIIKIYLQEDGPAKRKGSNEEAYYKLIEDFRAADQSKEIVVTPRVKSDYLPLEPVNKEAFLGEWRALKDTHDFFGMLMRHKVHRHYALTLGEGEFTYKLDPLAVRTMLETAANDKLPIMIFAGNNGNIQIHQGKIQTVRVMDNWLNILDPDFNMHLRADHMADVWVVKKPTTDGVVTALEVFDEEKNMIAQFFGLRKPGIPERNEWRELVDKLPVLAANA